MAACGNGKYDDCTWSEAHWYDAISEHWNNHKNADIQALNQAKELAKERGLAPGMVHVTDPRYSLRPEAIESVFILYRITGEKQLQEKAWSMFQTITNSTKTQFGYASMSDVTVEQPKLLDSMESFWTAETLKYFYLIFSEPHVISLDKYVFNTEAHPLLRPT